MPFTQQLKIKYSDFYDIVTKYNVQWEHTDDGKYLYFYFNVIEDAENVVEELEPYIIMNKLTE